MFVSGVCIGNENVGADCGWRKFVAIALAATQRSHFSQNDLVFLLLIAFPTPDHESTFLLVTSTSMV